VTRAALAAALLLAAGTADAGGLGRPNPGSPHAVGLGGAFGAIADDATCLHVNPSGCANAAPGWLAALELVVAPRTYKPEDGSPSQDATAVAPAPVIGALFKPGRADSPLTVGVGAWNTYGGMLHWERFDDPTRPALNESRELVFEVAAGAGWAANDRVSLGAAIRFGVGLFAIDATAMPVDTELSATGIGVGASAGVTVRATDALTIGLGWRSNLDVTTSGSGTLNIVGQGPRAVDTEHVQRWPQSASLSAAYRAGAALLLAAQLDWTQWSRFEELVIAFPGAGVPDQVFPLDWDDVLTARLGAQYTASPRLQLRGGLVRDGNAVPDRTIERQYLDAVKYGLSAGASVALSSRLVLDLALDLVGGPSRTVADNSDETEMWPERTNRAPGEHGGQVFTLASGVRVAL
jgi:long-chain fatty acid transport protein